MTMAFSRRTRVILAFVAPCLVYAAMLLVALRNFDRPDIHNDILQAAVIISLAAGFVWLVPEYVAFGRQRPLSVIASLFVPPLLLIVIFVVHEEVRKATGVDFSAWLPGAWMTSAALGAGLLLLARVFRLYTIPLGLVYVPAMWFVLLMIGYTLSISYGYG